ncbi:MAG: hypothetical protein L3K02_01270 [Thermoplasmata archaeon]|nr:hypothetical protein [Thermoplasmata archaeon]
MSDNTGDTIVIAKWSIGAALGVLIVAALMFGTVANVVATAPPPVSGYTVTIGETGLPSGQWWGATVNGVTHYVKAPSSNVFTGLSASTYYYYPATIGSNSSANTRWVSYSYYIPIYVPTQLANTVAYTEQFYTTFAITPVSSGSTTPTSNWYNAGSEVAIAGYDAQGYSFSKWTVSPSGSFTLAKSGSQATEVKITGVGTVTANFKQSKYSTSFSEVGLPSTSSWSVVFDGASSSSTTASTITTAAHAAGNYAWSVAPVSVGSSVEYVAVPASGNSLNVPNQPSQEIVFIKEVSLTFAVSPSPSGTTAPAAGTGFFVNGSVFPVTAYNGGGYIFSKWSLNESKVGIGSSSSQSTNATVKASTIITAKFVSGSECTTCSLKFTEIGLPTGAAWGVTFGPTNYVSSTTSLTVVGITGAASWAAFEPVGAGHNNLAYIPAYIGTTYTGSGYYSLGSTNSIEVVYTEYAWVTVNTNPSSPGGGAGPTQTTGWYQMNTPYPLSAIDSTTYTFSSWSTGGKNVTVGKSTSSSTTLTIAGPGTLTLNYAQFSSTIRFQEFGLPTGTTWAIDLTVGTGVWFTSSNQWINITDVPYGSWSWSALTLIYAGTGAVWNPMTPSGGAIPTNTATGSVDAPFQTAQAVVWGEEFSDTFAVSGTGPGTTNPTPGSAVWYWSGLVVPIMSENTSTGTFNAWSASTGAATFASSSSAATFATITGTGTITAKFT